MLVDLITSTALSEGDYKRHCGSCDQQLLRTAEHTGSRNTVNLGRILATAYHKQMARLLCSPWRGSDAKLITLIDQSAQVKCCFDQ